ncbi:MAG TPA: hypothetical protein VGZ26_09915 [Pirellulales bacterium]|nr:hypothetical protein [Pirellulales bacterium]
MAAIRSFIEPWRSAIAEVIERPYEDVYPDDYSLDNDPEDVIIKIRPRNNKAAPLELLVYSSQADRVDITIDRWSHLAALLGIKQPREMRGLGFRVAIAGGFESLEFAHHVIQAAAYGDIVVKTAIIGRRMRGTSAMVQLPSGRTLKCPSRIGGFVGAKLLSFIGLAEVRTYRYEPWES